MMGVTSYFNSIFIIRFISLLILFSQNPYLVTCDALDDDSLQNALDAIERRQRNLQLEEGEYYGQPENIGYGFQKNFGFFDNGPARELGSSDVGADEESELQSMLLSYLNSPREEEYDKRTSNFRERGVNRLVKEQQLDDGYGTSGIEYLQVLKNLWSKYRRAHPDSDLNLEDVTDEQVEDMLRSLAEDEEQYAAERYEPVEPAAARYQGIPLRNRRNYRVFDHLGSRKKRYPAFGQGLYGKRSVHSQHVGYQPPSDNDFLYSLKFVNPDMNREAVEVLRDDAYGPGDDKDADVLRVLSNALKHSKPVSDEYESGVWQQEPVYYPEETYFSDRRNEKKYNPHFFKSHNGLHLNTKRFPVKRSAGGSQNNDEKVTKELKGIFGETSTTSTTVSPPAKMTEKKATAEVKKQNVTKVSSTKKVVRRASTTKEEMYPSTRNDEITSLFNVKKKSVDWSQYFGLNKRLPLMNKRYPSSNLGNVNFLDGSQYQPFDTRLYSPKKRYSYDIDSNINKMENKIGNIEEKIIDEAVKYTGAHTGAKNEDLRQVKGDVIRHLEAAYSLEKMKSALEDFKKSMKGEKPSASVVEHPVETSTLKAEVSAKTDRPEASTKSAVEPEKRVAVKKEWPQDELEFLNEKEDEECPVLEHVLHNCLRVEELAGPYAELLLPICTLQQICYVCGNELGFTRPSSCDLMYLSEAQTLCRNDGDCLMSARDSMLALRDLNEEDMSSKNEQRLSRGTCAANPCIQRYFLSTPGAVVPLEFHN